MPGIAARLAEERDLDEITHKSNRFYADYNLYHIIPADHHIHLLEVGFIWFEQLTAAQYLWVYIRWEFRNRADSLSAGYDPRSPLKDVLKLKPSHLPKIEIMAAINGPIMLNADTLVFSALRG